MAVEPVPSSTITISGHKVALYNDQFFSQLRKAHGLGDDFLSGIDNVKDAMKKSDAKGGNMMGFIGSDFVIKDLTGGDHAALLDIAEGYVKHMTTGESLLVPIYLHYQLDGVNYFVMGNCVGQGAALEKYDLKGCNDDKMLEKDRKPIKVIHKRWFKLLMWCGNSCGQQSDARTIYANGKAQARSVKFTVSPEQREKVVAKIKRDTDYLAAANLMDYSLLVAVREGPAGKFEQDRHHLPCQQPFIRPMADGTGDHATFVGIVDYLQKWNMAKVIAKHIKFLETNKATIEPEPYAKRFYEHFNASFIGK